MSFGQKGRGPAKLFYTRADLCELFGISRSTLHRWSEQGFDIDSLEAVCEKWAAQQGYLKPTPVSWIDRFRTALVDGTTVSCTPERDPEDLR